MYERRNGILWFANSYDYHNYVLLPNTLYLQSRKIKTIDGDEIEYEYAIITIIYRDHSSEGGSVNVMRKKTLRYHGLEGEKEGKEGGRNVVSRRKKNCQYIKVSLVEKKNGGGGDG